MEFMRKEGFLLALLSIASFWVCYMYETGYADTFGISHELIDVDLKAMVIGIAVVVLSLVPLVGYCYVMFKLGSTKSRHSRWFAIKMVMPLPMLMCLYVSGFTSLLIWVGLAFAVFFSTISVIVVAIKARKIGWMNALAAAADSEGIQERNGERTPSGDPTIWHGFFGLVMAFFMVVMVSLIIRGVGIGVANTKVAYPSFTMDGKVYAVLSNYGDRFVLGGVDEGHYNGNTYVIPKNSDKIINLKLVRYKGFLK
ncbi:MULTISPECIES: hypothetical protein [Pseudomonas]|uniref:hypothetical protein n=1 Tax=Pseudomonas TaxID=286 RepID=UPI00070D7D56|nr:MULTISPECIES: hypothetical protein [Pseudomonas]WIN05189.1 hypothetical protein QQF68_16400 [Pseudomonas syringae pv. antirrhini str. 126]